MAVRTMSLDEFREHLSNAKDRLSLEKQSILDLHPLPEGFSREEYAFAYVRAERLGLRAINRRLAEIAWLPMQLDPEAEIVAESRSSMKRWLTSSLIGATQLDRIRQRLHPCARPLRHSMWLGGRRDHSPCLAHRRVVP